jgi:hypothetical protein
MYNNSTWTQPKKGKKGCRSVQANAEHSSGQRAAVTLTSVISDEREPIKMLRKVPVAP